MRTVRYFFTATVLLASIVLGSMTGASIAQDAKPAVPIFTPPENKDNKNVKESTVLPKASPPKEVVTPPKEAKKDKEKIKVDEEPENDGAALPLSFVKNRIETMPMGTKAFVLVTDVRVDSNRKCYLHPDGIYGSNAEGRVVQVVKEETGFSLVLDKEGVNHQWVAQELPPDVKWLPVKSITAK